MLERTRLINETQPVRGTHYLACEPQSDVSEQFVLVQFYFWKHLD